MLLIGTTLIGLSCGLFRNIYTTFIDKHFNVINGTAPTTISHGLTVNNSFINYSFFDTSIYLQKAFTSTWIDAYGRQHFWNFFFKSMLFGEFTFPYTHA